MQYKIAINRMALTGKLEPGDPRWAQLNDGFVHREIEMIDFVDAIYQGHAYSAWFNGRRKADNFLCAQHIAVDMDTEDERSTLATLRANRFFRMYGAIVHTTHSHTPQAPKARAIFLLDQPITNARGYKLAIATVAHFF